MLESFIVTSRETLEASLVVGIVLSYLYNTNRKSLFKYVYYGIIAGIIFSVFSAFVFGEIFSSGIFVGEIFEGITMILGTVLITTMLFWMKNVSKKNIENKVDERTAWGIFFLVFVSIIREGIETVIFLKAIDFANGINFVSALIGVLVSIGLGYFIFKNSKNVNLKFLFFVSTIFLIFVSGGLLAHGIHEFEEVGILNGIVSPLYNVNNFVNEKDVFGSFMKGLFGYNGNPSLLEILFYLIYISGAFYFFFRKNKVKKSQMTTI